MRERIFIVGGGSSLKGLPLGWLRFEDTIGVNYAAFNMPEPTYFLTADSGVISKSVINNFWGIKSKKVVVINSKEHPRWNNVKDYVPKFDEHVIPTRWDGEISLDQNNFATGKNTGFCALQYAIHLGYKEIYLLGFDLQKTNGKKYYYGDGGTDSPYDLFYEHFKIGLEKIKGIVNVYSCSSVSRLNKHIPYVKLLSLVPLMPVFTSHYTIKTPYEDIVKYLVKSLEKFNLDYDIEPIKSFGFWRTNSNYCAKSTLKMLEKYKPRPILRLDADATIEKFPILFDKKFRPDIGGCIYKQSKLKPEGEFMGGTIYFGNTERSREICKIWVDECERHPNHRNGDLLWRIIHREKNMLFKEMPISYCRIFDFPNMGPEIVIQHWQASRKCKGIINKR